METSLIASIINFLILIGILVVKLRAPLRSYIANRHQLVRDEIQNVAERLRQAQEKFDEYSAKLKAIDAEIATLREQVKNEVNQIKQRVNLEARQSASRMIAEAKNAADGLIHDFKEELYQELNLKALSQAESLLKDHLNSEDRIKIRNDFTRQVETVL